MKFDESVLRSIIRKAIQEQKLFELVFTDEGRRLWATWPEEQFRRIVKEELKKRR
jgi:hypothetical protein